MVKSMDDRNTSKIRKAPDLAGLEDFAVQAKVSSVARTNEKGDNAKPLKKEKTGPVKKRRAKPTSFYMTDIDKKRVRELAASVNELSRSMKISESMVLRALLVIGVKMKPETIFEGVKKVIF